MKIIYTAENGQTVKSQMSRDQAEKRLQYLDEQEAYTREVAPTDSGVVRIDYQREAEAIRSAL